VLTASFGAGVVFEFIIDAESIADIADIADIEVIDVIEVVELGEGVNNDKRSDTAALGGDAVVEVPAGTEDGAAVLAGGLPVHGITIMIEASRTSVNVE
jgi:hypothetical protein